MSQKQGQYGIKVGAHKHHYMHCLAYYLTLFLIFLTDVVGGGMPKSILALGSSSSLSSSSVVVGAAASAASMGSSRVASSTAPEAYYTEDNADADVDTDTDISGRVNSGPGVAARHVARWLQQDDVTAEEGYNNGTSWSAVLNGTNATDATNGTSFESIVVVTIDKDFANATLEEIIQFQEAFKNSYNFANGVPGMNNTTTTTNSSSSGGGSSTGSSVFNVTTTDNCTVTPDPVGREITNVTVDLDFAFNPGLANVSLNAVRRERHHYRGLQEQQAVVPGQDKGGANTNATIELPPQRYIQIALFVSAMCTRCPADQSLFDDVNDDVALRRLLEETTTSTGPVQQDQDQANRDAPCTPRGPTLEEVTSILASQTSYEVGTLIQVYGLELPSPSKMYFTEVVLPLNVDYFIATSQSGQEALEYFFLTTYNELTQQNYCDPFVRTVMYAQVDGILDDSMDGEIVEISFLVEVHCFGVDCEQYGHALFDDSAEPEKPTTPSRKRSRTLQQQESPRLRAARRHSPRQQQYEEDVSSWMVSKSSTFPDKKQTIMNMNERHLQTVGNGNSQRREDEYEFYCNVKSIGSRAPSHHEFLEMYQGVLDEAQATPGSSNGIEEGSDSPTDSWTNAPTSTVLPVATAAPSTAPSDAPTPAPTDLPTPAPTILTQCGAANGEVICPVHAPYCRNDDFCSPNIQYAESGQCQPDYSYSGTCGRCGADFYDVICADPEYPFCSEYDYCGQSTDHEQTCQPDYSVPGTCF